MTANDFTFYSRADYFKELTRLVQEVEPGERIATATMSLNVQDELVNSLIEALSAAAQRGVNVHVVIDAYTFLSRDRSPLPGPLWGRRDLPTSLPEPYNFQLDAIEKLRVSGATCAITNMPMKPLAPPPTGRSHIKAAIVGDTVFVGGCNLESAHEIDVMVRWHNRDSADWLHAWLVKMSETSSTRRTFNGQDQQFNIPNGPSLLIDAGVPKQSLIFDDALRLIDDAHKHLFLTSQYFPGGTTGRHLHAAHKRGAEVHIIYNPPKTHGKKAFMHYLYNAREHGRVPAAFFNESLPSGTPYLHAKVLISETAAMVGSHNFISQGVTFGTAEIALLWRDADFAQALQTFITQQITAQTNRHTS